MIENNNINSLPKGIRFIRGAYWFLVAGGSLVLVGKLAGLPSVQKYSTAVISFNTLIDLAILFGIYKKKVWLVPLLLLYAYLNIMGRLALVVLPQASDIRMLEGRFVHMMLAVFCIYQVIVFSRKETKLYYSEKGQTII
jgi:hypothetical protein